MGRAFLPQFNLKWKNSVAFLPTSWEVALRTPCFGNSLPSEALLWDYWRVKRGPGNCGDRFHGPPVYKHLGLPFKWMFFPMFTVSRKEFSTLVTFSGFLIILLVSIFVKNRSHSFLEDRYMFQWIIRNTKENKTKLFNTLDLQVERFLFYTLPGGPSLLLFINSPSI